MSCWHLKHETQTLGVPTKHGRRASLCVHVCVACTVASVAVQAASVEGGLPRKGAVKDIYGKENESKR